MKKTRNLLTLLALLIATYANAQTIIPSGQCYTIATKVNEVFEGFLNPSENRMLTLPNGNSLIRPVKSFRFKGSDGLVTINTIGSNFDTQIFISQESNSGDVLIGYNDDSQNISPQSSYSLNILSEYTYRVDVIPFSASINTSDYIILNFIGLNPLPVTTQNPPCSTANFLSWQNTTVNCEQTSFSQTVNTTNTFSSNSIALDFQLSYDPEYLLPSLGDLGAGSTSYGAGQLTVLEPGIAQVSVYLNQAPQGVYFLPNAALVNINWGILQPVSFTTEFIVTMSDLVASFPVGYEAFNSPDPVTFTIEARTEIELLKLDGSTLGSVATVNSMSANCTVVESTANASATSGLADLNVSNATNIQIVKDILGDQSVAKANCVVVSNYINSADVYEVLNIVNGTSTFSNKDLLGADVNLDGAITSADAALISSRAINEYGCEFPQIDNYNTDGTPKSNYTPSRDWLFVSTTEADAFNFNRFAVPFIDACMPLPTSCTSVPTSYYGVLLGDVNQSLSSTDTQRLSELSRVVLSFEEAIQTSDNKYLIPVKFNHADFTFGIDLVVSLGDLPFAVDSIVSVSGISTKWSKNSANLLLQTFEYNGIQELQTLFYLVSTSLPSNISNTNLDNGITAYINGNKAVVRQSLINSNSLEYLSEEIVIFPNPVTDQLFVNGLPKSSETVSLELRETSGKVILSIFNTSVTNSSARLDLSTIEVGSYILVIQNNDFTISRKVVKQ